MSIRGNLLFNLLTYFLCIILDYKNLKFKYLIDDLVIDLCLSGKFSSMKDIIRECNPMEDLSKFTSNKMILSGVVTLEPVWLEGWKSIRIEKF